MGGGVLPVAFRASGPVCLFSREAADGGSKDRGMWSDFGGSRENDETQYDTAVREATEESAGFLGTSSDVAALIRGKLLAAIPVQGYTTHLVEVPYDKGLPARFAAEYSRACREEPDAVAARNGLFEKDMLRWVPVSSLRAFQREFRPWYVRAGMASRIGRLDWRALEASARARAGVAARAATVATAKTNVVHG